MDLHGKKVLITGASKGIGEAVAREFAARGAALAISARRLEVLESLADSIGVAPATRPLAFAADLSKRGEADKLAAQVLRTFGAVDVLVNNAAVEGIGSYWQSGDSSEARDLFEMNYWSPMALARALIPRMIKKGNGAVVNVSSLGAITPILGTGHYPSTKAALAIATEALRTELASSGVCMILVFPGLVDTPMFRDFRARPNLSENMQRNLRFFPMGKPGGLARVLAKAILRERASVVYPRVYAMTPLLPTLSRWVTRRLLAD